MKTRSIISSTLLAACLGLGLSAPAQAHKGDVSLGWLDDGYYYPYVRHNRYYGDHNHHKYYKKNQKRHFWRHHDDDRHDWRHNDQRRDYDRHDDDDRDRRR